MDTENKNLENITQNGSMGALEAREGQEKPKEPLDEGLKAKTGSWDSGEPSRTKKSHKGLIITIILTLILALGAGVAWWFMAGPGKTEAGSSEEGETDQPETPSDGGELGEGETSKLVDVDLNSPEFHSVFDGFNTIMTWSFIGSRQANPVLVAEEITDNMALSWASDSTVAQPCEWWQGKLRPIALGRVDGYVEDVASLTGTDKDAFKNQIRDTINEERWLFRSDCYTGEDLRTRAWEMFGRDIALKDGQIFTHLYMAEIAYAEELDVFYPWPFYGGGHPGPIYFLAYEAKKDADRMYVKSVIDWCFDENEREMTGCDNVDYVKEHLNEMDYEFSWTFKKMSSGRYVFEKVERIKEPAADE